MPVEGINLKCDLESLYTTFDVKQYLWVVLQQSHPSLHRPEISSHLKKLPKQFRGSQNPDFLTIVHSDFCIKTIDDIDYCTIKTLEHWLLARKPSM